MINLDRCEREDELLDSLGRGFVTDELTAHMGECVACAELHLVAGALLQDRVQAIEEAPVPASGTMWWRMQMRQRHDAQVMARRSLFVGQAVTLAIALVLVAALLGSEVVSGVRDVVASVKLSTPLLLALASSLLLFPAGWIAIRQK